MYLQKTKKGFKLWNKKPTRIKRIVLPNYITKNGEIIKEKNA